jgi:hypothetical protein
MEDLAMERFIYQSIVFETVSSTFYGAILYDLVLCFPAECRYSFYPEFRELYMTGKLPSTPCLL